MPICCGVVERVITPTMVSPDIDTYKTMAVDKETGKRAVINSRKQHKEFLRRNDYIEIGTQEFKPSKRAPEPVEEITFDMGDL